MRTKTKKKVFILILIFALMGIPAFLISNHFRNSVITEMQLRSSAIAAVVEVLINQQSDAYKALSQTEIYENGTYDEVYYQYMNRQLHKVLIETGADFIFTEKWVDSDTIAYILDGTDPADERFSPIGSLDFMGQDERLAFLEGRPTVTGLIKDPLWGMYITAFSPIIDESDGTVIGLVGVDFSAQAVYEMSRSMDWIIGVSFFFLVILASFGMFSMIDYIYRFSYTDYLTESTSRRYFSNKLKVLVRNATAKKQPFCLMMIDIDWFKHINDTNGHLFGDKLLVDVAKTIREHIRSIDICSRYGGDEFTVLLPDSNITHAKIVAGKILEAAKHLTVDEEKPISVSIGLVEWSEQMDERMMLDAVDKALYRAKEQGKGRIIVH